MFRFIKRVYSADISHIALSGFIFLCVPACAGLPPVKEYSFAREALQQAKKFRADKNSPGYYKKSLKLYQSGKSAFKDRYYDRARDYFQESMEYAERAENLTRVRRARLGDHDF